MEAHSSSPKASTSFASQPVRLRTFLRNNLRARCTGKHPHGSGVPIKDASGKITGIPAIGPRTVIGNPNPNAYWSFVNDIGLGRALSFRAQFDGVQGGDIFNFDRRLLETPALEAARLTRTS